MATNDEMIKQMYNSNLNSKKEQLTTDYEKALSDLDQQKADNQKVVDTNVQRVTAAAQKAKVNNEEYYAASGLSSGAKAQARLAQENQLQANLTALRAAQQEADASVERQRGLLANEYASAIRKAQADNDLALAQALYNEAQNAEAKLLAKQEAAANMMAQTGDYSRYGELYGLSDEEIRKLSGASGGGYGGSGGGGTGGSIDNGSVDKKGIYAMQEALGVTADGLWGPKSQAAAQEKWGVSDADSAWKNFQKTDASYYSDWTALDWEAYFARIRQDEGTAAAQEELQYFTSNGLIPKKMVVYAASGARGGKMGH